MIHLIIGNNFFLSSYCGQNYNQVCGAFTNAASKGMDLLDEILKVSFQIEDLPLQTFSFDGYSGHVPFTIYNFVSGTFLSVSWFSHVLQFISFTMVTYFLLIFDRITFYFQHV